MKWGRRGPKKNKSTPKCAGVDRPMTCEVRPKDLGLKCECGSEFLSCIFCVLLCTFVMCMFVGRYCKYFGV